MTQKWQKNFFPAFVVNLIFWFLWFYVILKIPPNFTNQFLIIGFQINIPLALIYFFLTFFLSLTLTLAFIFSNTRRGALASLFVCGILLLFLIKQAHLLNFILLGGIIILLEVYFSKKT